MSDVNPFFDVTLDDHWIRIQKKEQASYENYRFYVDGRLVASFEQGDEFYLIKPVARTPNTMKVIVNRADVRNSADAVFHFSLRNNLTTHQPGDVLVASDNVNEKLTGIFGHAAIVVGEDRLIETPGGEPAIVKDSISQFKRKHPKHAVFRPLSDQLAKDAAGYAENYYREYRKKWAAGDRRPVYSVTLTQDLTDPWEYIYCSKLVWLCYYYGAGYEIENDMLWLSPEDLYTQLSKSGDFQTIYENEGVNFIINS